MSVSLYMDVHVPQAQERHEICPDPIHSRKSIDGDNVLAFSSNNYDVRLEACPVGAEANVLKN